MKFVQEHHARESSGPRSGDDGQRVAFRSFRAGIEFAPLSHGHRFKDMIDPRCLRCIQCEQTVTVRTAIGHADYQEFAFPCPRCGVEIRYGMTIDQQQPDIRYPRIVNAAWVDGLPPTDFTVCHDPETLVHRDLPPHVSPFIATSFGPIDPGKFHADRALRFHCFQKVWPVLQNCRTYYKNEDWQRFDERMKALNPRFTSAGPAFNRDHLFRYHRNFAIPFTPFSEPKRHLLEERLGHAEELSQKLCYELRKWLHGIAWNQLLEDQFFAIKEQWASVFHMISPIYMALYWDPSKHDIDEYRLSQKRFVDLKPFYIDVFESLARISVIAVGIEGILRDSGLRYPTRKGDRPLEDYRKMANGSKWHVLQNMLVGDCFSELSDSGLRNGIGHNAAHYVVLQDAIQYRNEPKNAPAVTGILHDGSRLFVWLRNVLARRDLGCWDAFGLVEIEDIRPPDERNADCLAVLAHDHVPGFVTLFEDLVVDDGSGFLALLHVPAKVERLPETDPERGLIVHGTKKQGVDSAVGFARDDVLDGEPEFLPGHGSAFQLLDEPLGDGFVDVAFHSATSRRAASMAASASSCVSWNRRAMTSESGSPSCVRVNSGVSSAPMFRSM